METNNTIETAVATDTTAAVAGKGLSFNQKVGLFSAGAAVGIGVFEGVKALVKWGKSKKAAKAEAAEQPTAVEEEVNPEN